MLQLIHFVLLTLGLTYIVTQSSIMIFPRMWIAARSMLLKTLIYCPACTGFWVGGGLQLTHDYGFTGPLTAAVTACGLMATWTLAFLHTSSWNMEQENAPTETQEERHGQ